MTDRIRPVSIVDTLFPGRRVHLVAGASGSGKTTWLMQIIEQWRQALPIYGYESIPCPFTLLSYDRDHDDFFDTCERLKIDPSSYNFVAPSSVESKISLLDYLRILQTKQPETRLYIVEALGVKTPQGKINDQSIVGPWLREVQEFCKKNEVTIIGTVHAAKTKERDRYKEPRARIAGCAAWAGYTSTIVVIEEKEADGESELRELLILPRNARKHKYMLDFKDGFLVEAKKGKKPTAALPRFTAWVYTKTPGLVVTTAQMKEETGLADSNLHGDIERHSKAPMKLLEKIAHGQYMVLSREQQN